MVLSTIAVLFFFPEERLVTEAIPFQVVSFRNQIKLEPDWSLLGFDSNLSTSISDIFKGDPPRGNKDKLDAKQVFLTP